MIDDREVALWIKRLETEESSWSNYEKLAALYTIQNQNREPVRESRMIEAYSAAGLAAFARGNSAHERGFPEGRFILQKTFILCKFFAVP